MTPRYTRAPNQRHLFVTGDGGFVGRQLTRVLEARGHRVTGFATSTRTPERTRADLTDIDSYIRHLEQADALVHLAAATGRVPSARYYESNVNGTAALLDAARQAGIKHFLFVSSIAVTFPDVRRYPYAQTKQLAEQLVARSAMPHTIVRPTMIFGQASPVAQGLIRLASLPFVPALGGANALVQPLFVDDLAEMLADILESDASSGDVLEMGGPETVSLRDVLARMHRLIHHQPARFVDIPLKPLITVTGWLERIAESLLPITVGQLHTFRFDGTARPNAVWNARQKQLKSVDAMIGHSLG